MYAPLWSSLPPVSSFLQDVVLGGQVRDQLRSTGLQHQPAEVVGPAVTGPVQGLKPVEEDQEPFDVAQGQPVVHREQRVSHRVQDVVCLEVIAQFIDALAYLLKLLELRFRDAEHQAVDLAAVLREVRGQFRGQKGVGQVRDGEGALDRVVVGDGHVLHAPFPGPCVDDLRFHKTLGGTDAPQDPLARTIRELAVNMQISSCLHTAGLL
jgi:hypothetical protein